jgi:hypothetical protein
VSPSSRRESSSSSSSVAVVVQTNKKAQHALGLAGLQELILRPPPPPPAAAAVRPFYSNFDWLDYGLPGVAWLARPGLASWPTTNLPGTTVPSLATGTTDCLPPSFFPATHVSSTGGEAEKAGLSANHSY